MPPVGWHSSHRDHLLSHHSPSQGRWPCGSHCAGSRAVVSLQSWGKWQIPHHRGGPWQPEIRTDKMSNRPTLGIAPTNRVETSTSSGSRRWHTSVSACISRLFTSSSPSATKADSNPSKIKLLTGCMNCKQLLLVQTTSPQHWCLVFYLAWLRHRKNCWVLTNCK